MDSLLWLSSVREGLRDRLKAVLSKPCQMPARSCQRRIEQPIQRVEALESRQLLSVAIDLSGDLVDQPDTLTQAFESPDASIVQAMSGLYASMYGATSVAEGSTYYLSLSPIANGTIASWTVYWGDGTASYGITSSPATHVYRDGTTAYSIQGTAYLGTTGIPASPRSVLVQNAAPSLYVSGSGEAWVGEEYTLDVAKLSDPGLDTVSRWTIDWGDQTTGTVSGESGIGTHTYQTDGTYYVTAKATDEDGTYVGGVVALSVYRMEVRPFRSAFPLEITLPAGGGNPAAVTFTMEEWDTKVQARVHTALKCEAPVRQHGTGNPAGIAVTGTYNAGGGLAGTTTFTVNVTASMVARGDRYTVAIYDPASPGSVKKYIAVINIL